MLNMQKKNKRIIGILCLVVCFFMTSLAGCKKKTVTFTENQVLRVNDHYMTTGHAMVLLCGLQNKYETMFGEQCWTINFGDSTLDQYIKEQVKTQLVQLAGMNALAGKKNITLSENEKSIAEKATDEYLQCYTKEQLEAAGIKREMVLELYLQYALADKVYSQITKDVNQEISDDQARMIDVQVILFKYAQDELQTADTEESSIVSTAYQVWERANAGENFESLAVEFNQGGQFEYHVGRGEMESAFEEAAFQLTDGQISGLVEGEEGIYIIKCISNYNQIETDANKSTIYKENCSKIFNEEYNSFIKGAEVKLNESAWEKVSVVSDVTLPQVDFVEIYETVQEL